MFFGNVFTPSEEDEDVQLLLKHLDSDIELLTIPITPEANSKTLDCIGNVNKKVSNDGGRIIYGWQIWKTKFLVEAIFHAIWEAPDGETLLDITPPENPSMSHILFLEDEKIKYTGRQIETVRMNISNNKLVDHLIAVNKAEYRLKNRGEKAHLIFDEFLASLSSEEIKILERIAIYKNNISYMLDMGGNIEALCHCGTTKKYKNCHGKDFIKKMNKL